MLNFEEKLCLFYVNGDAAKKNKIVVSGCIELAKLAFREFEQKPEITHSNT